MRAQTIGMYDLATRNMRNDVYWESVRAANVSTSEYPTWECYMVDRLLTDRFRRPEQLAAIRTAFDRWHSLK